MSKQFILVLFLCFFINFALASTGDQSRYYQNCVVTCVKVNCTEDGLHFVQSQPEDVFLKLMQWSCEEECRYGCMWNTVDVFAKRKWPVPQFHGKWPFIRFFGIQEIASVVFSLLNLFIHAQMIKRYSEKIRPDSPFYLMWYFFTVVNINTWVWSTIFHARDFLFTEVMDYSCAFSLVVMNCYCMCVRLLRNIVPRFALITLTTIFVAFFINHVAYLSTGKFSYAYNMQLNILIGAITAISWFSWCAWNRKRQPYVWKCAAFVTLYAVTILLEVMDFPPFFWVVDSHSLWHLSSAPLAHLFYSFIIDDCKYLRHQKHKLEELGEGEKKRAN